jgi:hypothetical protein
VDFSGVALKRRRMSGICMERTKHCKSRTRDVTCAAAVLRPCNHQIQYVVRLWRNPEAALDSSRIHMHPLQDLGRQPGIRAQESNMINWCLVGMSWGRAPVPVS